MLATTEDPFALSETRLRREVSEHLKAHFKGFTVRRNARRRWLEVPGHTPLQLDFLVEELDIAIEVRGLHQPHSASDYAKAELCQVCGIDFFVVRDFRVLTAITDHVYKRAKLPYRADPRWRFQWTYKDADSERLIFQHAEVMISALEQQLREKADPYAPYMRIQECLWRHTRINPLAESDSSLGRRAAVARSLARSSLKHLVNH